MAAALLAISRAVPRACKPAAQSASSFLRGSQSGTCVHKRMAGSFAQSFQSGWPDREIQDFKVPKRTVPEDKLRFQVRATFNSGSTAMLYGHLPGHPADFKVHLYVNVNDLGLTSAEESVLRRLVGKRYNPGRNEITLVADQFPSRMENKKYLVLLLENLCSEARRLAAEFKDDIKPRSSQTSSAQS